MLTQGHFWNLLYIFPDSFSFDPLALPTEDSRDTRTQLPMPKARDDIRVSRTDGERLVESDLMISK